MAIQVSLKPVVTEKSMNLAHNGFYTFEVPKQANKLSIAKTVAEAYKVEVLAVNIVKRPSKVKQRGRIVGRTKAQVKAVVKLKKGQSIPGFELTSPEAHEDESSEKATDKKPESEKQGKDK